MGLLPEIHRRRLYERKGYESIFVFAKKLAGLSERQIRRVLNLERRFDNTPVLKAMLVSGEVSVNKLARVASIATRVNEEVLADKLRVLPKSAIETLVRDEKFARNDIANDLPKPKIEAKSVPGHTLQLSDEVTTKLLELQGKGIDVNEFLLEALEKREQEIKKEKVVIAEELDQTESRYIPVKIKRVIQKEHGNKCSIRSCCREAVAIHHTQTFALGKTHDPRFLAPLCKDHHAIAHSINIKIARVKNQVILA